MKGLFSNGSFELYMENHNNVSRNECKSKKSWADDLLQRFGFLASFVKQKRDCLLIVGSGNPLFFICFISKQYIL